MSARHPRSMYKGTYTEHAINADHQIAANEDEESSLREDGYVDGLEFFSQAAEETETAEETTEAAPATPVAHKNRGGRKPKAAKPADVSPVTD